MKLNIPILKNSDELKIVQPEAAGGATIKDKLMLASSKKIMRHN